MSRHILELENGWTVNIGHCACDHGDAVIINTFEHPIEGYNVFSESATPGDAQASDHNDALTTAAHDHAVSIGALSA